MDLAGRRTAAERRAALVRPLGLVLTHAAISGAGEAAVQRWRERRLAQLAQLG